MKTQINPERSRTVEAIAWAAILGSGAFVWSYFHASEMALQSPNPDTAIAAEILEVQVKE